MPAVYWRLALLPMSCNNITQPILLGPLDQANFTPNNGTINCKHRIQTVANQKKQTVKLITQPEETWRNKKQIKLLGSQRINWNKGDKRVFIRTRGKVISQPKLHISSVLDGKNFMTHFS
jgi:hypothetical protein